MFKLIMKAFDSFYSAADILGVMSLASCCFLPSEKGCKNELLHCTVLLFMAESS